MTDPKIVINLNETWNLVITFGDVGCYLTPDIRYRMKYVKVGDQPKEEFPKIGVKKDLCPHCAGTGNKPVDPYEFTKQPCLERYEKRPYAQVCRFCKKEKAD